MFYGSHIVTCMHFTVSVSVRSEHVRGHTNADELLTVGELPTKLALRVPKLALGILGGNIPKNYMEIPKLIQ